ncbi:MAG: hypothetical protein ABFD91_10070, partial [Anaerohalosphaeraceae bacterium]
MRLKITIITLGIVLVTAMGLLGWRLYVLQFKQAETYAKNSQRQQTSVIPLHAQRGTLFDSRGNVLAASNTADEVFIEPRRIANPE